MSSDVNGQLSAQQQLQLLQQQQMLLNRSNQHWRLSHRKTEIQNKERQLKRVKEEDKDQSTNKSTVYWPGADQRELIGVEQQQTVDDKQQALLGSKPYEERPINEADPKQLIKDQLDVFNEPAVTGEASSSDGKQINESEINKQAQEADSQGGNSKRTSAYLHLPLDSSQLNNPLSPDVILPPPSSPVNPAYSLKQRSRNKRYKIERRLNSLTGNKNSSDESDQQMNQHASSNEDEDEDVYEIDSSVNSSAEEDELIDMESTEERTTKLYSKSDFEKLLSDTSEQESEGQLEKGELESKDLFEKQLTNLDANAQPANSTNNLLTVQHSHSSDKLKSLDSQSSPNSPTVLSSAASSATLVASPLNKQAPESLGAKDSFDADESCRDDDVAADKQEPQYHVSRRQSRENVKDKNNVSSKPQSSVSFSNQVTKTNYLSNQPPIASTSRTSTPKHVPPQPQYFLWNPKDAQPTNPFTTNVDYQPHHKLSTTSTTSGASMNYLRVKSSKNAAASADNHGLILDSCNTTPRASFQSDFSTPRSSFQMSESQQMMSSKAGVVVTSSRNSTRRSSSASAASAFAAATAASSKYYCLKILTDQRCSNKALFF